MSQLDALRQLAIESQQRGDWLAAEQAFRRLRAISPDQPEFLHGLAYSLFQSGRREASVEMLRTSLAEFPMPAALHNSLGTMLRQMGRVIESVACFEHALKLDPGLWHAHYNLGNAFHQLGQLDAAAAQFRAVLQRESGDADVYFNLGVVERQREHFDDARWCFQQALARNPSYSEASLLLGHVERSVGNLAAAIAHYRRAAELGPNLAKNWRALGQAVLSRNDPPEAIAALTRATVLDANDATSWAELGNAYEANSEADRAVQCFENAAAVSHDRSWSVKAALTLPVIIESTAAIELARAQLDRNLAQLSEQAFDVCDPVVTVKTPAFALAYHGRNDREFQSRIAQLVARVTPSLSYVAPHCRRQLTRLQRRIRIGFISTNFREHTIGKLNAGMIQRFDRRRFEVIVLRFAGAEDGMSRQIVDSGERSLTLPHALDAARMVIAEEELDVLFYTDIGIAPLTYYLAHARLAQVQCVTWGHPLTTGIPAVDYFVSSDALETPGSEDQYTEQLVRLPRLANYYFRPSPPASTWTRLDYGFGDGQTVYACLQSPFKLHPDDDEVFAAILDADPAGILLLLESPFRHWTEIVQARFARSMPHLAHRIRFVPQQPPDEFSKLLSLVDALLDPLHFGGGETTYQSFAVGAPVVTLPSRFLRGRITAALYRQLGVDAVIATDVNDYVAKALRLANDRPWRKMISDAISDQSPAIYENLAGVNALEDFLEQTFSTA